jgi:hypothetical protein
MTKGKKSSRRRLSAEFCTPRINYAKLKVDKRVEENSSLTKAPELKKASGHDLTQSYDDNGEKGHGLSGDFDRPPVPTRRCAGDMMSDNSFENAPDLGGALGIALENGASPKCRIDCERYREFFDDAMISNEMKDQIIEMLFLIGHAFYDAGFAYEFEGQACGKLGETGDGAALKLQDMIGLSKLTLTQQFNPHAAG